MKELIIIVVTLVVFNQSCTSHTIDEVYSNVRDNYEKMNQVERVMISMRDAMREVYSLVKSHDQQFENIEHRLKSVEASAKSQDETLKTLNEEVKDQRTVLNNQQQTLEKQNKALDTQGKTLKAFEKAIEDQILILRGQGGTLSKQEKNLEKVDKRLNNLESLEMDEVNVLKAHGEALKKLDRDAESQGGIIKGQGKTLVKQEQTLVKQSKTLETQGQALREQKETLVKQNQMLEKLDVDVENVRNSSEENFKNISEDVQTSKNILTEVPPGKTPSSPAESCSWLNEHHYNLNSGKYWFSKDGGSSYEYCKMDEAGVLPDSCKEWKKSDPDLKSGIYNTTIKGKLFEVVCDMETGGGGWLLVGKAVVKTNEEAKEVDYRKIRHDEYTQLKKVKSGRFLLSTIGLNSLFDSLQEPFSEIRFECTKKYHGRRMNLKTKGTDVVQWLLHRRSKEPKPQACGTFTKLPNDSSFLGGHCDDWFGGTWYKNVMYDFPIGALDGGSGLYYYIALNYDKWQHLFCDDDDDSSHPNFNDIGEWSFYVR